MIFKDFDQNRYFSKILTDIRFFRKFYRNRDDSKIFTKIEIFENFDLIGNF